MKHFYTMALLLAGLSLRAQTTITKQGQNYWGGAYVAPQWTKTYKDYTPSNSSGSSGYSSSNYKSGSGSGSSSGYSSGSGSYTKMNQSVYRYNAEASQAASRERERLEKIRNSKAKKQADLFFAKLAEAKDMTLRQKTYPQAYSALTWDMPKIYEETKSAYAGFDASDEYIDLIKDYYTEVEYYMYLCQVKLNAYELASIFYNMNFATKDREPSPKTGEPLPLTARNFYFMNEGDYDIPAEFFKAGILRFSPEERLKIDLFYVNTLLGLGKKEDAQNALRHIIKFYEPIVPDFSYIADELALIYFNLREFDLAQKNLEYFCEFKQSNYYRQRLVTDILRDDGWDGKANPEAINFLERNLTFLENLQRETDTTGHVEFYDSDWSMLYTQKSNNPSAYVERKKEYLKLAEKDPDFSYYGDKYLAALVKVNDEKEINRVLLKLKAIGETHTKNNMDFYQKELDTLLLKYRGFTVKKDYEQGMFNNCWQRYYFYQAKPVINALFYFGDGMLKDFYKLGGYKYVKPVVAEYLGFLNQFTAEELGNDISYMEYVGAQLKLKRSRSYPKVFDPPAVKLNLLGKL